MWTEKWCHLLVSGHHYEDMFINIGDNRIWESKNVELFGITIDKDLKFEKHVNEICSKTDRKLNVLSRMWSFLSAGKRLIIFKSSFKTQSNTVLWLGCFVVEKGNNKIYRLHYRSLRIVNNDYENEEFLSHNNWFSIYDQNIYHLATEIYKVANNLSVVDFLIKKCLILKISIPYISL